MSLLDYFIKSRQKHIENSIVYIHGAGASSLSFNYIKSNLPEYSSFDISYQTTDTLEKNLHTIKNTLESNFDSDPINIISHSLGGNIAAILKTEFGMNINKLVTMSTPFAGSKMLYLASLIYPTTQLFKDAKHTSKFMCKTKNVILDNTLCFVTTAGYNPVVGLEPNDGVVTVKSQKTVRPTKMIELPLNHTEVLLSPQVITDIKKFIKI